jgi:hypothetical protein
MVVSVTLRPSAELLRWEQRLDRSQVPQVSPGLRDLGFYRLHGFNWFCSVASGHPKTQAECAFRELYVLLIFPTKDVGHPPLIESVVCRVSYTWDERVAPCVRLRMPHNLTSCADPKTCIAALALLVSFLSLFLSWRSGRRADRALVISEGQEQRRQPRLNIYLLRGYRRLAPKRQLFGFLVSVSNPTDANNSIARAELQITYLLENDVNVVSRVQHAQDLNDNKSSDTLGAATIFCLPARIDAHQTLSGWFLFALDDNVIGQGTVEAHCLILEDTHGISTDTGPIMVQEWTHDGKKN